MIEIPPENIEGDLAFPCFQISKELKKNPNIIAQELSTKLTQSTPAPMVQLAGHFTKFTTV